MTPTDELPDTPFVSGDADEPTMRLFTKKWGLITLGVAALLIVSAVWLLIGIKNSQPVAISSTVANVTIERTNFIPVDIKIKRGQQITWTNEDATPHRLTADQVDLPGFDTPEPLNQGDSYTYIFDKAGKFRYYDPTAPKTYVGTITVQ